MLNHEVTIIMCVGGAFGESINLTATVELFEAKEAIKVMREAARAPATLETCDCTPVVSESDCGCSKSRGT